MDSYCTLHVVDRMNLKEIEATLHCLMSIQEASPIEDHVDLGRLFGAEVLGLFPKTGFTRVRRTTVVLIGNSLGHPLYSRSNESRFLCVLVHCPTAKWLVAVDELYSICGRGIIRAISVPPGCECSQEPVRCQSGGTRPTFTRFRCPSREPYECSCKDRTHNFSLR